MKMIKFVVLTSILFAPLSAAYTVKEGKLVNADEMATMSVQEHHSAVLEAYQEKKWDELVHQATIVLKNFPEAPFAQEAPFYLGAGYFHLGNYDMANKYLSRYLRKQVALQHFRDAIELKFYIADKFREGTKRHLMGFESLPKWVPAYDEALKLYDEVISALPNDELAAKALFGKAALQIADEEFKPAIETYQNLIRRFPKNALAPEAYVQIGKIYLSQCQEQYPDTDFLDLAEINLRKFQQDFPSDPRIATAEKMLTDMQEIYAQSFYEIGQFFERTKKSHASILYYSKILKTYPNTKSAELAKKRLHALQPHQESEHSQIAQDQTSAAHAPS
jgi:outer membrane assembly lipoprotein YfiO